ncbi:MAG: zinc metallopeptidase [Bacteroidales bacterium]|nr:zinc metallopeptidase [Bacteroidales bacterium]
MQLDGRRQSTNVDDRRGGSTAMVVGGIGLGGVLIFGLIKILILGASPTEVLGDIAGQLMANNSEMVSDSNWEPSEQEQELAVFASQILAGTEDIWTEIFKANGRKYEPPKLVLFNGSVQSGCGGATSSSGPFYCSADQCVYLDLSFFTSMRQQIGADGDFAYAYVIAHEVGHHVQYLLGTLQQAHNQMSRVSEAQANQISVRLELQADFYAGVWAYNDNKRFKSLEAGDIQEAIDAAGKIGDDYLQKQSYGRTVPDSFTHGTSEQRSRWLTKGLRTGDVSLGDTFSQPYNQL